MAVSIEILRSWRNPRAALRRQLASGATEGRALAYLMGACGLIFVAQWPRLAREAELAPEVPLDARLAGALLAIVFVLPLVFYGVAALSHLVARLFGGRGSWFGARLALFWTLLVTVPLFLLRGMVAGMIGPGPALVATETVVVAGFLIHWLLALAEAEA